jgi:hypothetical protein
MKTFLLEWGKPVTVRSARHWRKRPADWRVPGGRYAGRTDSSALAIQSWAHTGPLIQGNDDPVKGAPGF